MAWGPDDCGPDGFTPDGAPCVPDTNTPPNRTPPNTTPPGDCPRFYPGGPCATGTSAPAGNPTGDLGDSGGLSNWQPFKYNFDFGDAPPFTARRFSAPKPEDILNKPEFKWLQDQGISALQNSAASRGVARTGNTAKGLIDYGRNSASQYYGNAFNQALDVFRTDYQGDLDEYKPKLISYQTRAAGNQRAQELSAADMWRKYLADLDWNKFLLGEV